MKLDDSIVPLEKEAVLMSLQNLLTFPFVEEAVANEKLVLHGLYTNLEEGSLEHYRHGDGGFVPV